MRLALTSCSHFEPCIVSTYPACGYGVTYLISTNFHSQHGHRRKIGFVGVYGWWGLKERPTGRPTYLQAMNSLLKEHAMFGGSIQIPK